MLEALKGWVLNICTAIFFITAVEMILPSNSMKKYTKFVLGLILITVLVNPILKLLSSEFDMNNYIDTATRYFEDKHYENDYNQYKSKSISNTAEVFANNLESLCNEKLKEKYPKDNYEVAIKVEYDEKDEKFVIGKVDVGIKEGNISKVKKVDINNSKEVNGKEVVSEEKGKNIIEYLSKAIDIPKEKINIYKI